MAFAKAKVALATLEEKLRRQLGLAGEIGSSFAPDLKPVLITGDLREPGNAFFKGRHWAVSQALNNGAGTQYMSFLFNADVIVYGFIFQGGAAGLTNCVYVTTPAQAPAIIANVAAGTWIDRRQGTADTPPIFASAIGALTGTNFSVQNMVFNQCVGNVTPAIVPMQMCLPAGSHINAAYNGAGNVALSIWGRIAEST